MGLVVLLCSVGVDALALKRIDFWITAVIFGWSTVFGLIFNNFVCIWMFRLILPGEADSLKAEIASRPVDPPRDNLV